MPGKLIMFSTKKKPESVIHEIKIYNLNFYLLLIKNKDVKSLMTKPVKFHAINLLTTFRINHKHSTKTDKTRTQTLNTLIPPRFITLVLMLEHNSRCRNFDYFRQH